MPKCSSTPLHPVRSPLFFPITTRVPVVQPRDWQALVSAFRTIRLQELCSKRVTGRLPPRVRIPRENRARRQLLTLGGICTAHFRDLLMPGRLVLVSSRRLSIVPRRFRLFYGREGLRKNSLNR